MMEQVALNESSLLLKNIFKTHKHYNFFTIKIKTESTKWSTVLILPIRLEFTASANDTYITYFCIKSSMSNQKMQVRTQNWFKLVTP
jgi:hypothetical protein